MFQLSGENSITCLSCSLKMLKGLSDDKGEPQNNQSQICSCSHCISTIDPAEFQVHDEPRMLMGDRRVGRVGVICSNAMLM